jgi:hypothetical protein
MTDKAMSEREAFEAWARTQNIDTEYSALVDGSYVSFIANVAWVTWQARASLAASADQAEPRHCPSCNSQRSGDGTH